MKRQQTGVNKARSYTAVYDGRKRKVRSLWRRDGRFYARIKIAFPDEEVAKVRRLPLKAKTVPDAMRELRELLVRRDHGRVVVRERTPTLEEFGQQYLVRLAEGQRKRPKTISSERGHLNFWIRELGGRRLQKITPGQIKLAMDRRAAEGRSPRTLNIGLTVLRNVFSEAIGEGLVDQNPCLGVRWRKVTKRDRRLVTAGELDRLCEAALRVSQNGPQFVDFLRLLQYCGSRMAETLRLRWADVDWDQKQLIIGADGESKNHEARRVDFNTSLEAHLMNMHRRRDSDSQWMFPSPQRGKKDIPAKSFRETLLMAREEAGLEHVGFHDCRHHFISMSVMAGIDYMTIAAWVGHKDGGILIGKVYGHLANEHRQRAAQKLVLGSVGVIDGERIHAA